MDLYYYTSTDTMQYILTKEDIYATNIRYMNDSEEYLNGLREIYDLTKRQDIVKKWLQNREGSSLNQNHIKKVFTEENLEKNKRETEYYSISFCRKNDLLSQWAIYAKESGVSIKMRFQKETYRFTAKCKEEKETAVWNLFPQKVHYFTYQSMQDDEEHYGKEAYEILDQIFDKKTLEQTEDKLDEWQYVSTFVKRYDFYQEEEHRLVFDPTKLSCQPLIEYRMDKKVLKPYLDIQCENGWPIWEIMIGPGFNQQIVYESVEHFLNHRKIKADICTLKDYAIRVQEYIHLYDKDLIQIQDYQQLKAKLEQILEADLEERKDERNLEDEKSDLFQMLCVVINVVNDKPKGFETIKEYFMSHHFSESGIVLTKSSIPYIY